MNVEKKPISDWLKHDQYFKCELCGTLFTYKPHQKVVDAECPFCKKKLVPSSPPPPVSSEISKEKTYVHTIKDKKGKIIKIVEISEEEFKKLNQNKDKKELVFPDAPKDEFHNTPDTLYINILTKSAESCAITKILRKIVDNVVSNELFSKERISIVMVEEESPTFEGLKNPSSSFLPQITLVYNNKIVQYSTIHNLNEETFTSSLIGLFSLLKISQLK